MTHPPALIVGAGPTGLVLALWLTRRGVRVRIIDKVAEPGTTSRALVVHARTLEFYRQLGITDAVVQRSHRFAAGNLWVNDRVKWFSTYRVHHRVANRFRQGRAFLLGDAAHIHSPVGGQGMNTGIGDAVNLAWKLADVVQGRAAPSLLDTYEPERIAFARRLVATTDRAFTIVSSSGRMARFLRTVIAPRVLPLLFRSKSIRRYMFRVISQTSINYRHSALSEGATGKLRAGDRLPWVAPELAAGNDPDNFAPLKSLDWQVHVYGDCPPEVTDWCRTLGLERHVFPWGPMAARTGLVKGALYLIRPDGHIGLAQAEPKLGDLQQYLNAHVRGALDSPAASPK